ncbi:pyridoxamine 5'-phosphate oxidase family protein [Helicovermis profundi]|uniref:Pyridoxamine 5'-phosphate oxidase family protein n=1 Tax=Helicovermis profundi TaxID=3065157 RepID=A0AAU9ECA7_9FIRM|nr:pyridoxamine 5'-phosphate oxidase family protein [Clostridia bacterium S502]
MITEKLKKVLTTSGLVSIATVTKEGMPKVRSVDFAVDKEDLRKFYFMTFKNTEKVEELNNNNNVYITMDKEANSMEELSKICYIKGSGKANLLLEEEKIKKAMGLLLQKYPYLENLTGDPSLINVYEVKLEEILLTDNSISFGHTDVIV